MQPPGRYKVVHLTTVHDPGDTRITHRECATLAENGYDVVLIARDLRRAMPGGVRHRSIPNAGNRFERFTKVMHAAYCAARAEKANLYHIHDPELIPVGLILAARGKRVVFDAHEDIPADVALKHWVPRPLRPAVTALLSLLLRIAERSFYGIVAATPVIAKRYRYGRTVVVRNYPRVEDFSASSDLESYSKRPQAAAYVGDVTAIRGAQQMVTAIGHVSLPEEARLFLVGEIESRSLADNLARLPGWSRTVAYGRLERFELPAILGRARVGLLVFQTTRASVTDGLPTKLFEYMAAGLPVIASSSLRCRDLITGLGCGLVIDSASSAEIAKALLHILEDPANAYRMGQRGRAAVQAQFNWASETPSLLRLYSEASGGAH